MATAPAIPASRTTLHTRATWSARDDRGASAVWLGILWIGMIAGFGVDIPRYLRENPPAPLIIHIHAVIFTLWMLLITVQVLLVVGNRVALHRRLGWLLAAWAVLMVIMGPVAIMTSAAVNLHTPGVMSPPFVAVGFENVISFGGLLGWGLLLRRNPAAHRRLMILSSVALADPGFSRFSGWLWPHEPAFAPLWFLYTFYGNLLLMLLMAAWDWYRGRLMRQFIVGACALVAAEFTVTVLYFWPAWRSLSLAWVTAWGHLFSY